MSIMADAERNSSVTDRIVLTLPSAERYRSIGTLVLGGVGTRAEISYERVDDLQIAMLSALDAASVGEVTLEIDADESGVALAVGPLREGSEADDGLARVLSRLVDDVEHARRDGSVWVTLRLRATA